MNMTAIFLVTNKLGNIFIIWNHAYELIYKCMIWPHQLILVLKSSLKIKWITVRSFDISIFFQFNNINYKIIWWKECLLTDEWVLSVVLMSLVLTKIRTRMRNHTNRCVYFNYLWMHHNTVSGHWLAATDTLVPCPSSPWNTFFCFPSTGFCFHFENESKMQMAGTSFPFISL